MPPPLVAVEIPVIEQSPTRSAQTKNSEGVSPEKTRLGDLGDGEPLLYRLSDHAPTPNTTILCRHADASRVTYTIAVGTMVMDVDLDEILDFVSPLHLEEFETKEFEVEREVFAVAEAEKRKEQEARFEKRQRAIQRQLEADSDRDEQSGTPVETGKHGRKRPTYTQFYLKTQPRRKGSLLQREATASEDDATAASASVEQPQSGDGTAVGYLPELPKRRRRRRHPLTGELMPLGWRYNPDDEVATSQTKSNSPPPEPESKRQRVGSESEFSRETTPVLRKAEIAAKWTPQAVFAERKAEHLATLRRAIARHGSPAPNLDDLVTEEGGHLRHVPAKSPQNNTMSQSALRIPSAESSSEPDQLASFFPRVVVPARSTSIHAARTRSQSPRAPPPKPASVVASHVTHAASPQPLVNQGTSTKATAAQPPALTATTAAQAALGKSAATKPPPQQGVSTECAKPQASPSKSAQKATSEVLAKSAPTAKTAASKLASSTSTTTMPAATKPATTKPVTPKPAASTPAATKPTATTQRTPAKPGPQPGRKGVDKNLPNALIAINEKGQQVWCVEKIVAHAWCDPKTHPRKISEMIYRVKWQGDPVMTWEPTESFQSPEILQAYRRSVGLDPPLKTPVQLASPDTTDNEQGLASATPEDDSDSEIVVQLPTKTETTTKASSSGPAKGKGKAKELEARADDGETYATADEGDTDSKKSDDSVYLVEKIVQHHWSDPKSHPPQLGDEPVMLYQVKWLNSNEMTWEPASSFVEQEVVREYNAKHGITAR